jgi:hypothetical protein
VSLADIRDGLATNLATISGLRTTADLPDNPSPPIAMVQINNISYDEAFQGGLVFYNFTITVVVGRVSERSAQNRLNAFASTGVGGIKHAVESDKTLGGEAFDVRLQEMTSMGAITLGETQYMACEFSVQVMSN